jgi:N6-L-threonylcarbamoyladenine synthase
MEFIIPVLEQVMWRKNKTDIDAIAVTVGPGLATSLQVGINTAKSLSYAWQKTLIPVNHLEGHLYSPLLLGEKKIKFPAIGLIVSGGHTLLLLVKDYLKYKLLGCTRDDAAGEAFDKVAKLLGLGYPGGPLISKLATNGDSTKYSFPRGMINSGDYDFSFSGLKTSVLYMTKKNKAILNKKELPHVAASFEQAVIDVLVTKTIKAAQKNKAQTILLGGGVTANKLLRETLVSENEKQKTKVQVLIPDLSLTTDNAAMIALAGYFRYKAKKFVKPNPQLKKWQAIKAEPNLRL